MYKVHICRVALILLAVAFAAESAFGDVIWDFPDDAGDTYGVLDPQHDMLNTRVLLAATCITFEVAFADPVSPPSQFGADLVAGYLELDLDQDASTGAESNVTRFGNEPSGLGVEYFIDLSSELFDPGYVELVDAATVTAMARLPILFGSHSFSLTIPLDQLNHDDGAMNFGIIVGNLTAPTPSPTDQLVGSVPEPQGALLFTLALAVLIGIGTRSKLAGKDRVRSEDTRSATAMGGTG